MLIRRRRGWELPETAATPEREQVLDIDDLLARMPLEERLYRHRCVFALVALALRSEAQKRCRPYCSTAMRSSSPIFMWEWKTSRYLCDFGGCLNRSLCKTTIRYAIGATGS